jgi:predicted TPR repeat methyltransferase
VNFHIKSRQQDAEIVLKILKETVEKHQAGQLDEAEDGYLKILGLEPDNREALFNYSFLLRSTERQVQALPWLEKLAVLEPENSEVLFSLGVLLHQNDKLSEALVFYEKTLKLCPGHLEVLENLGIIFKAQQNYKRAEFYFQQLLELAPDTPQFFSTLGVLYVEQGRFDKASSVFENLLSLTPDDPEVHYNLGVIYSSLGFLEKAVISYQQAIELAPGYITAFFNLAIIKKQQGQFSEAISIFQHALTLDPDDPEIYYNLAIALTEAGKPEEAVRNYYQAIKVNPDYPEAWGNLGFLLVLKGRTDEAIDAFTRVVELADDHLSAKHMLAALKGETPDFAPREYVTSLFDNYAEKFDQHLAENLKYKTPSEIRRVLDSCLPEKRVFSQAIDLGCGTGLSGLSFKDISKRMTGIDLAPKMLEAAEKKGIYEALFQAEIIEFLRQSQEQYDLFIATDVFVYIGDLSQVFEEVKRSSLGRSYFVFSTEDADRALKADDIGEKGFILQKSGRYAHKQSYIEKLARLAGFSVKACQTAGIREENGVFIAGNIFILS